MIVYFYGLYVYVLGAVFYLHLFKDFEFVTRVNIFTFDGFSFWSNFCLVLSFCSFLFGEVSIEVGGLIRDLLSFGLVLEGDFSVTLLIGCVVGDSSIYFS